jgi:AraC-like DNA-binding protein
LDGHRLLRISESLLQSRNLSAMRHAVFCMRRTYLGLSRTSDRDTGASFTDRVLELRLQKARAMLADPRHDRLRVSEIAYACGFNDISYFNRSFRRRFGASPLQHRGGDPGQH